MYRAMCTVCTGHNAQGNELWIVQGVYCSHHTQRSALCQVHIIHIPVLLSWSECFSVLSHSPFAGDDWYYGLLGLLAIPVVGIVVCMLLRTKRSSFATVESSHYFVPPVPDLGVTNDAALYPESPASSLWPTPVVGSPFESTPVVLTPAEGGTPFESTPMVLTPSEATPLQISPFESISNTPITLPTTPIPLGSPGLELEFNEYPLL